MGEFIENEINSFCVTENISYHEMRTVLEDYIYFENEDSIYYPLSQKEITIYKKIRNLNAKGINNIILLNALNNRINMLQKIKRKWNNGKSTRS